MRNLLVVLLSVLFLSCFSQNLQFQKEKLNFTIEKDGFEVDGLYYFRNSTDDTLEQVILYPFPQSPGLGTVESVQIEAIYPEADTGILIQCNQKAAGFRLKMNPNDSAIIHVSYSQSTPNNRAEYILTSTQVWQNPLEQADFTLAIPMDIKIDSLSYHADSLIFTDHHLLYKWQFLDFMPERNFFVSFSEIKNRRR